MRITVYTRSENSYTHINAQQIHSKDHQRWLVIKEKSGSETWYPTSAVERVRVES